MVWQTFKYTTWLTFKMHQGCHQLHIWGSIDLITLRYHEVIIGPWHPIQHEWSLQKSITSARPYDCVWMNSINSQFGLKINSYQQRNTTPNYVTQLEVNSSNKLKNHIVKWNFLENVPYSTGTIFILVHISTLFSVHKSDRHKDLWQDWVVYEEEPKSGLL